MRRRTRWAGLVLVVAKRSWCASWGLLVAACKGPQSALDPAGQEAQRLADLFWWMTAGGVVIWLAVVGLAVYATYSPRAHSLKAANRLIVAGGVVFPTVVLAGLLAYGLAMLPGLTAPPPEGSLRILVTGEQWWWRVRYLPASGDPVDLTNEIRLPIGQPVEFHLESKDVIHSFWIPTLGGKVDMIPGRRTRLTLHPTKAGIYRGVCAEYCGTSHALMSFSVVVQAEDDFAAWLARQAEPAKTPADPLAERGADLFVANGCGACHAVRGTAADGTVGPDLTHVGSRLSLGAGVLPNERDDHRRWISHADELKPKVLMPAFRMLPPADLEALAAYLEGLQ